MADLAWYRNLKEIKTFEGRHAKFVGLLEHNIVKKSYHQEHREIFEHEVYCIKRLQNEKFIPRLLMVDDEKRVIYMSYCGKTVKNLSKYQHKINKYQKILDNVYGIHHNDLRVGNVCIDNKGQIYLIDFGWSREYQGVGGYGKGKIGNTKTEIPVTKKELLDFLKEIYYSDTINLSDIQSKIKDFFIRENDPLSNRKKDNTIPLIVVEENKLNINSNVVEENKENKENKEINVQKINVVEENKEMFDDNVDEENKEIFDDSVIEIIDNSVVEEKNGIINGVIKEKNGMISFDVVDERDKMDDVIGIDVDNKTVNANKVIENDNIEVIDVTTFKIQRQGNPYLWSQI
jgi:hypothetical protein